MSFVLRAFSKGADGVFIGACHLNECNYITNGNYHALSMVNICRKVMKQIGINPERLRLNFMSGAEASLYVEDVNEFVKEIKTLGPLGKSEGIEGNVLKMKLETATKLIPYIRLVERERLRIPFETEEEGYKLFNSDEVNRIFDETVVEKLAIGQIISLLQEGPLTTGEIAKGVGLTPSEVSRHLNSSSRQRLVRYDENQKRYALA
jgi:DNA-binding transcriptional ArsR family regulator